MPGLPRTIKVRFKDQRQEVEFDMEKDSVGDVANKVARTQFKFHGNFSFINPEDGEVLNSRGSMKDSPISYGDSVALVVVSTDA